MIPDTDKQEAEARRVYDDLASGHLPISQDAVDRLLWLLAVLAKSCQQALDGDWDRTDAGFNDMLDLIDQVLVQELKWELPELED